MILDPVWLELTPYPTIVGRAAFASRLASPAWGLIAFGAPASYSAKSPLAVVVRNAGHGPVSIHALISDPTRAVLIEAYQRASDQIWTIFRYQAASRTAIERMTGPGALERIGRTRNARTWSVSASRWVCSSRCSAPSTRPSPDQCARIGRAQSLRQRRPFHAVERRSGRPKAHRAWRL